MILMKKPKISFLFFISILVIIISCVEKNPKLSMRNVDSNSLSIESTLTLDKDSNSSKLLYIHDSLNYFLDKISLSYNVRKIKINLVNINKKNKSKDKFFQYNYGNNNITLVERYDPVNYIYLYKKLYINGKIINRFIEQSGDDWDQMEINLNNDVNDDSIPAILYITPKGIFLFFTGSAVDAATENYSKIAYNFLIPLVNSKSAGFVFLSYNVPANFYLGYEKSTSRIICLGFDIVFPTDDTSEYVYYIHGKDIDLNTVNINSIKDIQGKEYFINVAIPNANDLSKYRIIESYWWDKLGSNK
jgi:hypothetical protein